MKWIVKVRCQSIETWEVEAADLEDATANYGDGSLDSDEPEFSDVIAVNCKEGQNQ